MFCHASWVAAPSGRVRETHQIVAGGKKPSPAAYYDPKTDVSLAPRVDSLAMVDPRAAPCRSLQGPWNESLTDLIRQTSLAKSRRSARHWLTTIGRMIPPPRNPPKSLPASKSAIRADARNPEPSRFRGLHQ